MTTDTKCRTDHKPAPPDAGYLERLERLNQQCNGNALLRLWQIIGDKKRGIPALLPVSKTCFWEGVKSGLYLRRQGIMRLRTISGGFWDSEKPLADTCDAVRAAAVALAGEVMNTKAGELLTWQERQRRYADYIKDIDRSRLSLEKIGAFVEQAWLKYGEIGGIGIDYLGLVAAPGRDPYERIQHTAIETKNLAKSLNVPVVLLSQTSRAYGRQKWGKVITLSPFACHLPCKKSI